MMDRLDAWASEVGDTYVLGFVRALIGIFLFWQGLVSAQELTSVGYFGDYFHVPFTDIHLNYPKIVTPAFDIGGLHVPSFDLSITNHVVMMWIVAILLTLVFVSAARKAKEP